MSNEKMGRQTRKTQDLLKKVLIQLISEKDYKEVTIQDVVEQANVGRTIFYTHYENKDDLLLDSHAKFAEALVLRLLSYEELIDLLGRYCKICKQQTSPRATIRLRLTCQHKLI